MEVSRRGNIEQSSNTHDTPFLLPSSSAERPETQGEITSPAPPPEAETAPSWPPQMPPEQRRRLAILATTLPPERLAEIFDAQLIDEPPKTEPEADIPVEPLPPPKVLRVVDRPAPPTIEEVRERIKSGTLAEAGFEVVNFSDIEGIFLEPLDIVSGIQTLKQFNDVEQEIVGSLSPIGDQGSAAALAAEKIAQDRILNHVKPGRFAGRILAAQVILLSFDRQRAIQQSPHLRIALEKHDPEHDPPIKGITAIYTGLLQRSVGTVGTLHVESTYHVKTARRGKQNTIYFGYMHRTVGQTLIDQMSGTVTEQDLSSIARAELLTKYSLAHVMSGGLPTGGKLKGHGHR